MIYNLGLPRTGTTSLTNALGILGFEPVKHELPPNDKWEKIGKQHYCGGMPHMYRGIDRRYPDAKFIYTYRPVEEWLESVKKIFPEKPPSGVNDSRYNINNMVPAIFGVSKFDPDILETLFVQHQLGVLEYFKGRSDFLVFDVKTGWADLCRFLDCPVPQKPFPHHS